MQFDQDYYPGRRKRGKDYREDMVCPLALEYLLPDLFYVFLTLLVIDVLIAFVQLELPFFYPGQVPLKLWLYSLFSNLLTLFILTLINGWMYLTQICYGKVMSVHLYQGAFVDVGCVHDGYGLLFVFLIIELPLADLSSCVLFLVIFLLLSCFLIVTCELQRITVHEILPISILYCWMMNGMGLLYFP